MAKVYDALRRAEEERKRRAGDESAETQALQWEPATASPASHRAGLPFWKRWRPRLRRKRGADGGSLNKQRIALLQPDSFVSEQYRTLRGRIDAVAEQRPVRTVAISSPLPGEGKTTAAINLAVVTAMSLGRRVLLVDCDMRRPQVHKALGLRPEAGLAEILTETTSLDQAITKVEGINLEVLPVRSRPPNPSELLASPKMRELVEELAKRYDRVILDTPAALGLPDAKTVGDICDGVVVVVRADVTADRDVRAMLDTLDRRRILGLVLNGAREKLHGRYGYSY